MSPITTFETLLQQYGYDAYPQYDADAYVCFEDIVDQIIINVMRNVCAVTKVCKVKNAKKEHFDLVMFIQSTVIKEAANVVKGGRIVLPSEYFSGEQSGNYFERAVVAPYETTLFPVDPEITRPEIPIKVFGGKGANDYIQNKLSALQATKRVSCGVAKDGLVCLASAVEACLSNVLKAMRKSFPRPKMVQYKHLDSVLSRPEFAHLRPSKI